MWPFGFLSEMPFDTDSGGAPSGAAGAGQDGSASSPSGQDASGSPTPNPFDSLVEIIQQPAQPTVTQPQSRREGTDSQAQRSGSVQQPAQQLGTQPLEQADLRQPPAQGQPGQTTQPDPRDVQLQQLRDELTQLRTAVQTQRAPAQPTAQPSPAQPQRRYAFSAPPQAIEALRNDDASISTQAFFTLLSDAAEEIHNSVMRDVVQNLAPHLIQTAAQRATSVSDAQRVQDDFYNTHKDLNQEHLRPLVTSVASQYIQELGPRFKTYTPEFRDEVARRSRELIYRMAGRAQTFVPTPDQAAGRPNGGAAQLSPQGTRPASGVQPNGAIGDHNSPQAIAAALFG